VELYNRIRESGRVLSPISIGNSSSHSLLLLTEEKDILLVTRIGAASRDLVRVLIKSSSPFRVWIGRLGEEMVEEYTSLILSRQPRTSSDVVAGPSRCRALLCPSGSREVSLLRATDPVPESVVLMLRHLASLLESIRSSTPQLVVYLSSKDMDRLLAARKGGHTRSPPSPDEATPSSSSSGRLQDKRVDCKCMLMSNSPLPDFHVQFEDGTRVRYFLHSNRVSIVRSSGEEPIQWTGTIYVDVKLSPPRDGSAVSGSDRMLDCMPRRLRRYAEVAQKALSVCLYEQTALISRSTSLKSEGAGAPPIILLTE
jgi:hypothetical protein